MPNQTGGTPDDPFAGNTFELSRTELAKDDPYLFAPGTGAFYSNWGFDLLGLALANAGGKPYADLLAERVLGPRGLTDTKLNLARGRCGADRCRATSSTASPMPLVPSPGDDRMRGRALHLRRATCMKWMAWHLDRDAAGDADGGPIDHAGWLWRDGLSPVSGIDDAGPMGMMTLGWVGVLPDGRQAADAQQDRRPAGSVQLRGDRADARRRRLRLDQRLHRVGQRFAEGLGQDGLQLLRVDAVAVAPCPALVGPRPADEVNILLAAAILRVAHQLSARSASRTHLPDSG